MLRYRFVPAALFALLLNAAPGPSQELPREFKEKLDGLIAAAYESAAAGLPCKVKAGGKPRMIRWQDVDRCVNEAADRVDWQGLAAQLQPIRAAVTLSADDFNAILAGAFSARALPFDKVFFLKKPEAYLPLTNSLLKFLPADSLLDVDVIDKTGKQVGKFAGTYSYERTGGLATANTYRLTVFQYTDSAGNVQSANEKLLLGSFGVPWKTVQGQPGFRLTIDKLAPPRSK